MKILLITTFLTSLLFAAPAYHGKRTFVQPNGESVTYHLQGDEHLHWMEKEDGEIMLYSKKNKRMESAVIQDGELRPSGRAISHTKHSKQASSQQKKVTKKELETLYQLKREEHYKRMKNSHQHSKAH